jgi:glycosyltransferase involved in cell wall biosynthesis
VRIVYTSVLNPWDPRHGGGQRIVHELASAMAGRGHEVDVVYSGIGPVPFGSLPYRAHLIAHHERLYLNPIEFARFLRRTRLADGIVHANGYEGALLAYATRERKAFVVTSHHPDLPTLLDAPGYGHWIKRAEWIRRRIIALLERRALRSADLTTTTSTFSARALRDRGYLGQNVRIEVLHNGTPLLPAIRVPEAGVELVCVARLDQHKGIDVLLQALALLDNPKPLLDLVGIGCEEGRLRGIADDLNLKERVRFRGHLDRSGVAAILAAAVAFVLPSRSENFPLAILEAMQAGLPIIATRSGGIPEAVRHGEEALLVPPEDPAALADALKRILLDSELRCRLARAARVRAEAFTWARAAQLYESLYVSLWR